MIEFGTEIELGAGKDVVIAGEGAEATVLSGGGRTRFFALVDGANLTLVDLTLANATIGSTPPCGFSGRGADNLGGDCRGGAIWFYQGRLTVLRCILRNNDAYESLRAARALRF